MIAVVSDLETRRPVEEQTMNRLYVILNNDTSILPTPLDCCWAEDEGSVFVRYDYSGQPKRVGRLSARIPYRMELEVLAVRPGMLVPVRIVDAFER